MAKLRIFSQISRISSVLWIVLVSVSLPWCHGVCDSTQANNCLSTARSALGNLNTNPDNYCAPAGEIYVEVLACMMPYIDTCSDSQRSNFENSINNDIYTPINNRCSGESGCDAYADKYQTFYNCRSSSGGVDRVVQSVAQDWNRKVDGTPACVNFRAMSKCMVDLAANCRYLRMALGRFFYQTPEFKLSYDVCGSEAQHGAIYPTCEGKQSKMDQVAAECQLPDIDWEDAELIAQPGRLCITMQTQADCILSKTQGCEELLDHFLKPLLDTYNIMNKQFLCKIQIHGFEVHSIFDSSSVSLCPAEEVILCHQTFGIERNQDLSHLPNLRVLLDLSKVSTTQCQYLRYVQFAVIEQCLDEKLAYCSYPWMTQLRNRDFPNPIEYEESLNIYAINTIGLKYAADYIHLHCFIACGADDGNLLYNKFQDACNRDLNVEGTSRTIVNLQSRGDNIASECGILQEWGNCVTDKVQQCPAISDRIEDWIIAHQDVNDAVHDYCRTSIIYTPTMPTVPPQGSTKPRTIMTNPAQPKTTIVTMSTKTTQPVSKIAVITTTTTTTTTTMKPVTTPKGFSHGTLPPTTPTTTTTTTGSTTTLTVSTTGASIPATSLLTLLVAAIMSAIAGRIL